MLPWLLSNIQADQALHGIIRLGDETVVEVLTEEEAIFEHVGRRSHHMIRIMKM